MTFTSRQLVSLAAFAVVPLAGCDGTGALDPIAPGAAASTTAELAPAAAPAGLSFEARGTIDGRMTGTVQLPGGVGELFIIVIDSRPVGDVVHVEQVWQIHPPDPIQPFELRLQGVVDRSGVVLNGRAPTGPAHVMAELAGTTLRGDLRIVGFNPQPEPPAMRAFGAAPAAAELALARAGTAPFHDLATAADAEYEQGGFVVDGPVQPCRRVLRVANEGAKTPHVILFRLLPGSTKDDFDQWLRRPSEDDMPAVVAAAMAEMSPATEALLETDLSAGDDVLCFVTDRDGVPHLAKGRAQHLRIG